MKILAFDTCNNGCSVGLYVDGLLSTQNVEATQLQSSLLIPCIQNLLKKSSIDICGLDYLVLTNGPGSFTGVRVGLAAAIGFHLSHNLKTISINVLAATYTNFLALNASQTKILVINEAPRDEIYYQYFQDMRPLNEKPLLGTVDQIVTLSKNTLTIGNSKNKIPSLLENYITIPMLDMSLIAKSFVENFHSKEIFHLNDSLKPCYLRRAIIN